MIPPRPHNPEFDPSVEDGPPQAEGPHEEAAPDEGQGAAPDRIPGVTPEEIGSIPSLPGVYIMRDGQGQVIYIGKASNLKSRVNSYFTRSGDTRFNVRYLMRHVERIETIITANEKEAFLLENTLIKKHQPRYNIRLRDDKTYVSVRINVKHEWPRAVVMRKRDESPRDGAVYLGPYASASGVRDTLRQLQRIFPIRSCPDHVLHNRTRPCLLHSIGRCCAPCVKNVDHETYHEMVEGTILFLKGKTQEVLRTLKKQMWEASDGMDYERATVIRDRIQTIESTTERQAVHAHAGGDRDVVVLEREGGFGAFVVFVYRNGLLISSRPYLVRDHDREGIDLIEEFLSRYYELEIPPREILLDPAPQNTQLLEEWLGERREGRTALLAPQRGAKRQLVETARENARRLLKQHLSGQKTIEEIQGEIARRLHLAEPPEVIECYDISTIQGYATVGSMVTFRGGEPDKSRYRRFRIKSFEGQDDFGALREVLSRRFRRVAEGEEVAPDLVVIDGGKGQLAVAVAVFEELGISQIPVVGMAKARVKRRGDKTERSEERFFLPGRKNPVLFAANSPALYLLVRLRDEAHRFGITYHRELRRRRNLRSALEDIPGIGKTRAATLLRHFGSMKKLREASAEAIAAVPRMNQPLADRIVAHFEALASDAPIESAEHDLPAPDPVNEIDLIVDEESED